MDDLIFTPSGIRSIQLILDQDPRRLTLDLDQLTFILPSENAITWYFL